MLVDRLFLFFFSSLSSNFHEARRSGKRVMSAVGGMRCLRDIRCGLFFSGEKRMRKMVRREKGMRPRAVGEGISERGCERWTQGWLSR